MSLRDDFGLSKRPKYSDDELLHVSHLILVDEDTNEKLGEWQSQFPRLSPKYGQLPGKLEIRVRKDSSRHVEIVELMEGPQRRLMQD